MAAAYLLAAYKGTDLAANRTSVSVIALVDRGYLTPGLELTARGICFARGLEGCAKDWDRSQQFAGGLQGT